MLRLSIIFLFVSILLSIIGPSSPKESSNALKEVEKLENGGYIAVADVRSEKTGFANLHTEKNGEGTSGQTLEGCFGGFGRFLRRSRDKQKDAAKRRRCLCECHKRLIKEGSIKITKDQAAKIEKRCAYLNAGGCDGYGKCPVGRETERIGDTAGNLKVSLLRQANTPTEPRRETVPITSLNAVSGNVYRRVGQRTRRPKKNKYRNIKSVNKGSQHACCWSWDTCCDDCIVPTCMCICCIPLTYFAMLCSACT